MSSERGAVFARRIFQVAGWVGIAELVPLFFMERLVSARMPPAITHPEFFYGFLGVSLAWQALFLFLGSDPLRYRPLMIPAILEKASYVIVVFGLALAGRSPSEVLGGATLDLLWLALFAAAYVKTAPTTP